MAQKEGGRPSFLERTIITYSISHLTQSDKVRFYYSLKGRNGNSGIIHQFGFRQLAKTVLMTDPVHQDILISFLREWSCPFSTMPVYVKHEFSRKNRSREVRVGP